MTLIRYMQVAAGQNAVSLIFQRQNRNNCSLFLVSGGICWCWHTDRGRVLLYDPIQTSAAKPRVKQIPPIHIWVKYPDMITKSNCRLLKNDSEISRYHGQDLPYFSDIWLLTIVLVRLGRLRLCTQILQAYHNCVSLSLSHIILRRTERIGRLKTGGMINTPSKSSRHSPHLFGSPWFSLTFWSVAVFPIDYFLPNQRPPSGWNMWKSHHGFANHGANMSQCRLQVDWFQVTIKTQNVHTGWWSTSPQPDQ